MSRDPRAQGLSLGELIAGAGALLLLGSLWVSWYRINLSDELIARASGELRRFGDVGVWAAEQVESASEADVPPLSAWDVFSGRDVLLAAIAVGVLVVIVLGAQGLLVGGRAGLITLAGVVALIAVVQVLADPPLSTPLLEQPVLEAKSGLHAGFLGASLIFVGGILAGIRGPQTSFSTGTPTMLPHSVHDPS